MKHFKLLILLVVLFACNNNADNKKDNVINEAVKTDSVKNKIIETVITDLNNDTKADTIFLSKPPVEGDAGSFGTITVALSGLDKKTVVSDDEWDKVDEKFMNKNTNAVKSDKIFVYKSPDQTLILLFGFLYDTGREFSIIRIKNNEIKEVFDEDLEFPLQLSDFNNDGKIELLGKGRHEMYDQVDSLNADIGTYDPFYIYSFENGCKLDEAMSKKYNEENYVWAGPDASEKIKVLYPRDRSKPRIIN